MQKRNVLSALCAAFSLCAASALAAMPDAEFAELCRSGTAEQIQQALADGANPNARRGGEREIEETALMAATRNSSPEALKVLVAAGADVNARNNTGNTALMQAASLNSNPEMLEALLAAGADVNARNAFGATALLVATSQDNPGPFIKPLLAAGADPRTRADDGETPLIRAASYGNAEAIRILLAAGADPKIKDKKGHDALWHVRNADHRFVSGEQADEVIRLLQGGAKKPAKKPGASTLVEVRHAPAVEGKTPVTLKATAPLTLTFHELDYEGDGPKLGGVTATVELAAGETHTFTHVQPFDMPVQGICAQPQQGERKCWFPQDNEADDGGRFIMAPGFALKN